METSTASRVTSLSPDERIPQPLANIEAEHGLLGALLVNNAAFAQVADFVRPEHFSEALHGRIYAAIAKLIERGQIADPVSLKNLFDQDDSLVDIGGAAYVFKLANSAVSIMNAPHYGRTIVDLFVRRSMVALGQDISTNAGQIDLDLPAAAAASGLAAQFAELARVSPIVGEPDMAVLQMHRRQPPLFPITVFGAGWQRWIDAAAEAAACPPDYVAVPLLAAGSALIGNARWAQAGPGWSEPPHLWCAAVGDSGTGKSPGADSLLRDALPEIEKKMLADFPDRLQEWKAQAELARVMEQLWKTEVITAQKLGAAPPMPPAPVGPEPQAPRLRQNDVTIERVATLLASAAPKGLLIVRDELAGWISGMTAYHDGGRAFWIEAFGGRSFRVERQKTPEPIIVPHLAVAVYGGVQPDRLGALMHEADDGLLARMLWAWPDPIPFRLSRNAPHVDWAVESLERLHWLEMQPDSQPTMVPLAHDALPLLEEFGRAAQERQQAAGGLMRSALGKARGLALRLSLILEILWWSAARGTSPAPARITKHAIASAVSLLTDYFLPMAERVYGDSGTTRNNQNATMLARWIYREKPKEVHVRSLLRAVRLPGLTNAEAIHNAARALIEADWLREPARGTAGGRPRGSYSVNSRVWQAPL